MTAAWSQLTEEEQSAATALGSDEPNTTWELDATEPAVADDAAGRVPRLERGAIGCSGTADPMWWAFERRGDSESSESRKSAIRSESRKSAIQSNAVRIDCVLCNLSRVSESLSCLGSKVGRKKWWRAPALDGAQVGG